MMPTSPGTDIVPRVRLRAPRLSARPLPAHAFLPGVDPIPDSDRCEPRANPASSLADRYPALAWFDDEDYLYGCDLFNHGYWWEAHNAWEQVWNRCPAGSREAHLQQALIQAANVLLKHRMGRTRAVRRLLAEAGRHAQAVGGGACMGLDVQRWYQAFQGYAVGLPFDDFPEPGFPYLRPSERP